MTKKVMTLAVGAMALSMVIGSISGVALATRASEVPSQNKVIAVSNKETGKQEENKILNLINGKYTANLFAKKYIASLVTTKHADADLYATTDANIRANHTTDSHIVGSLQKGELIHINGITSNGWARVHYNGNRAFVKLSLLSENAPKKEEIKATAKSEKKEAEKKEAEMKEQDALVSDNPVVRTGESKTLYTIELQAVKVSGFSDGTYMDKDHDIYHQNGEGLWVRESDAAILYGSLEEAKAAAQKTTEEKTTEEKTTEEKQVEEKQVEEKQVEEVQEEEQQVEEVQQEEQVEEKQVEEKQQKEETQTPETQDQGQVEECE